MTTTFAPTDRTPAEAQRENMPVLDDDDMLFAARDSHAAIAKLMQPGFGR